MLRVAVTAAAQSIVGGAVVRAAGGADLGGAASGAADDLQWRCTWCSRKISVEL